MQIYDAILEIISYEREDKRLTIKQILFLLFSDAVLWGVRLAIFGFLAFTLFQIFAATYISQTAQIICPYIK